MGLTEQVAQRVGLGIRTRGGLRLIAAKDAERFLAGCREAEIVILGIEGFRFDGDTIIPDMHAIADFSTPKPPSVAESIGGAMRFMRTVARPGMWFDFELRKESTQA